MVKLNKQRKKKKFNYARNRKRERNIQEKTTKFNVKVDCKALKDNWDRQKSLKQNMLSLGVAFDANAVVPIKTTKKRFLESNLKTAESAAAAAETEKAATSAAATNSVIGQLEAEAAIVKPPTFRFSTEQVKWIREREDFVNFFCEFPVWWCASFFADLEGFDAGMASNV
jgi:hypothetical protein